MRRESGKLGSIVAALRSWSRQPEVESRTRPVLWVLLVGAVAFLGFVYSGAPKGPLAAVLPGPAEPPVVSAPTVAEFVADRAALVQRLRNRAGLPPVASRGDAAS
jgi:hypothetical protein